MQITNRYTNTFKCACGTIGVKKTRNQKRCTACAKQQRLAASKAHREKS